MIVGEGEILGQVREAWQAAEREGSAPASCSSRTVPPRGRVGKRARTETGDRPPRGVDLVGRGRASPPSSSARSTARRVLVLGAGEMGEGLARRACGRAASATIVVANRTARARRGARRASVGGRGDPARRVADALVDVDVLLTSTGVAARCSSSAATVEMVMACRDGRPLLVVDVGGAARRRPRRAAR